MAAAQTRTRPHDRPAVPPRRAAAFTLVELLVVVGIVAILVAILLPALGRARESANTVKCAANLHAIGQGIAAYVADFGGALPASNTWKGLRILPDQQVPTSPVYGTIHWSSYLYRGRGLHDGTDDVYRSLAGWAMFQCPSLDRGGLPPANTFVGNGELPNETSGNDPVTGKPVVDEQAPRLAYTLNEALCGRGFFVAGATAAESQIQRPYRFVRAASVRDSGGTILAAELWGQQSLVTAESLVDPGGGVYVSASRRPVGGFTSGLVGPEQLWQLPTGTGPYAKLFRLSRARVTDLTPDPSTTAGVGTTPITTLDWVGRNHGRRALDGQGFDVRRTNFLYLDGHVETKHVRDTLAPAFQWGAQFYSLTGGENVDAP